MFLSKIFLNKFADVELHALGEATKVAVRVCENLTRYGYTTISKINTFTYEPGKEDNSKADTRGNDRGGERKGKRVKMIIKLLRTKDFKQKAENIKTANQ
jgi:hypothetical protein